MDDGYCCSLLYCTCYSVKKVRLLSYAAMGPSRHGSVYCNSPPYKNIFSYVFKYIAITYQVCRISCLDNIIYQLDIPKFKISHNISMRAFIEH